jgi:hypothetical protein
MSKPKSPLPPTDDLEDVQTPWGVLPRWKARALAIGEIQAVINDSATKQPLTDEEKPPPLAADTMFADAVARVKRRQYYKDLYSRCDAIEQRLDILAAKEKAKMAAHAALMAAEAAFTATEDDDPDRVLN